MGLKTYVDYCLSRTFLVSAKLLILSLSAPKFTFGSSPQERFGLTLSVESENVRGGKKTSLQCVPMHRIAVESS